MTVVAYNINNRYYDGKHYLWCTPYFSSDYDSPHYTVPPSSSPFEIYKLFKQEAQATDQHGIKIPANRLGIKKGAVNMHARGKITKSQLREISHIAQKTERYQFRPILCVISRLEAVPHYRKVDIREKANPLSQEYILADLPQSAFDVISVG